MKADAAGLERVPFVDLGAQYLTIKPEVDAAMAEVIASTAFIKGRFLQAFERDFAQYLAVPHVVGVGNGTDALEIALTALALPPGSEVLVPAHSFVATAEAVTTAGHTVVFCDVDDRTHSLCPAAAAKRVTARTRAIIAVHLYGQPCAMEELGALARRHSLAVIEDCAQAHGARYKGRRLGTFGDVATFSFFPSKNLGAYGDGGAITTGRGDLAAFCRMYADHGRLAKYDHQIEGRNSRLDGLQAAVLSVKLKHLDAWNLRRVATATAYQSALSGVGDLVLPAVPPWAESAFHLYVVRTSYRNDLRQYLTDQGVESHVHYPTALPFLGAYKEQNQGVHAPVAQRLSGEVLSLPMGEHMTEARVRRVSDAIKRFFTRVA